MSGKSKPSIFSPLAAGLRPNPPAPSEKLIQHPQLDISIPAYRMAEVRTYLASLEKQKEKAVRKAKEAQKCSEEAHSKMKEAVAAQELSKRKADAEKARADEFERASDATRVKEQKLVEILERVKSEQITNLSITQKAMQNMGKHILQLNLTLSEVKAERDTLTERLRGKEREVEALKAKVEALSICLEDTLKRESRRLDEEYDKVDDYEWECCKVDESDSSE